MEKPLIEFLILLQAEPEFLDELFSVLGYVGPAQFILDSLVGFR